MIELFLVKDIPHLGKRGQRVRVRPGYARNFLLPFDAAVLATRENETMVTKSRNRWLAEEAKLIEELREHAARIGELDLRIVAKASEIGHLYGSVNERSIADAAAAAGVPFDARHIRISQPLKEVGDYQVLVHLHDQVEVTIPVRVRAEGREDWVPGADAAAEEAPADSAGGAAAPTA